MAVRMLRLFEASEANPVPVSPGACELSVSVAFVSAFVSVFVSV